MEIICVQFYYIGRDSKPGLKTEKRNVERLRKLIEKDIKVRMFKSVDLCDLYGRLTGSSTNWPLAIRLTEGELHLTQGIVKGCIERECESLEEDFKTSITEN